VSLSFDDLSLGRVPTPTTSYWSKRYLLYCEPEPQPPQTTTASSGGPPPRRQERYLLIELARANCDFVEVGYNSGVARALEVSVERALRYDPDWLLFLDHDTLLLGGAVEKALEVVDRLPPGVRGRLGAAFLGSAGGDCGVRGYRYGWFSGTPMRADIASKVCCKDDFFLDQADCERAPRA
jgi:GT2 family glycosyltransferase